MQEDDGDDDSLEYQGLNNDEAHLHGVEVVHTRHGDTEEQEALHCEYHVVRTESICHREIDERQNI